MLKSIFRHLPWFVMLLVATGMYFLSTPVMAATTNNDEVRMSATTTHSPPTVALKIEVSVMCSTASGTAREKSAYEVVSTESTDDGIIIRYAVSSNADPTDDEIIWQTARMTSRGSPFVSIMWTCDREQSSPDDQLANSFPPTAMIPGDTTYTGSTNIQVWVNNYMVSMEHTPLTAAVWCPNIGYNIDADSSVVITTLPDATPCLRIEEVWQPNIGFQSNGVAVKCGSCLSALSDYPNPFA